MQDVARMDRNRLIALVDDIQNIQIAYDLTLIPVPRRRLFHKKLLHMGADSNDALNHVGSRGALYFDDLRQTIPPQAYTG